MDSKLEKKKNHSYKPQECRASVWKFFFHLGNGICCWAFSILSFPGSSIGQESACNAGDPGLIPGSGRSSGEGIGFPLQFSWASLVAQMVKNPPANAGDLDSIPGWKDPLKKGKATTPVFCPGEFPGLYSPWGRKELDMTEWLSHSLYYIHYLQQNFSGIWALAWTM